MRIRLQVTPPGGRPYDVEHTGSVIRVGRDPGSEVTFKGDTVEGVSWNHALISMSASCVSVTDAGSTNGTYRNGTPVTAPQKLASGDAVQLGQSGPILRVLSIEGMVSGPGQTFPEGRGGLPAFQQNVNVRIDGGGLPAFQIAAPLPFSASPIPGLSGRAPSATRMLLIAMQNRWRTTSIIAGILVVAALGTLGYFVWQHEKRLDKMDDWVKNAETHFGRLDDRWYEQQHVNAEFAASVNDMTTRLDQVGNQVDELARDQARLRAQFSIHAQSVALLLNRGGGPGGAQVVRTRAVQPVPRPQRVEILTPQPAHILFYLNKRFEQRFGTLVALEPKRLRFKWDRYVVPFDNERAHVIQTRDDIYQYDAHVGGFVRALTHYSFDSSGQSFDASPYQDQFGRQLYTGQWSIVESGGLKLWGFVSRGAGGTLKLSIPGQGPSSIPSAEIQSISTEAGVFHFDQEVQRLVFTTQDEIQRRRNEQHFAMFLVTLAALRNQLQVSVEIPLGRLFKKPA